MMINVERTYYIVHIYFGDYIMGESNSYKVFEYQKSRRLTARQAWQYICGNNKALYEGKLQGNATVDTCWEIIAKHGLNQKLCNNYFTFGYIH